MSVERSYTVVGWPRNAATWVLQLASTGVASAPARELAASGFTGSHEWVVRDGRIVDCRRSALIRLLVRQHHPSGLAERYVRRFNRPSPCLTVESDRPNRMGRPGR